jgi:hypothetical protein
MTALDGAAKLARRNCSFYTVCDEENRRCTRRRGAYGWWRL